MHLQERFQVAQALDNCENEEPLSRKEVASPTRSIKSPIQGFNYFFIQQTDTKHETKAPPDDPDEDDNLAESMNHGGMGPNLYPLSAINPEKPSQDLTPRSLLGEAEGMPDKAPESESDIPKYAIFHL